MNSNMVCEFKKAKLDIFLKMKPNSGSMCKYEELKLRHSGEIYSTVRDWNHFYDRVLNEKKLRVKFNVVFNSC